MFPSASVDEHRRPGRRDPGRTRPPSGWSAARFLLWSSLSLFSVLESAFNIVYGRPNRAFLHGKARATLFMLALARHALRRPARRRSSARTLLDRYAPGFARQRASSPTRVSVLVSSIAIFVFLVSAYYVPDERRPDARARCCPGAIVATVALEATSRCCRSSSAVSKHNPVGCRRSAGRLLLLVWLYVMANVIVFGAEINWRRARLSEGSLQRRRGAAAVRVAPASSRRRARRPSASRPSGTKTGS